MMIILHFCLIGTAHKTKYISRKIGYIILEKLGKTERISMFQAS
jgi:hypothetical protein